MGLLDFLAQPSTADLRGALRNITVRKGGILPLTEYGDGSARLDWTAGVPGSIMEAFTAPARAYRGEIPEDQMIPEGLNFAGSVALGSAAVPRGRAASPNSPAPHVAMPSLPPENPVMRYLSPRHADIGMDSYNALALEAPAIRDFNPHDAGIIGLPGMRSASQPTTPLTSDFMGHQRFAGRRELDFVPDTESMVPSIGELANEGAGKLSPYDRTTLNQAWLRKVARTGELFSNPKESALPGTVLSSASHLDMSPEARMARAREMGFDTDQVLYHGTGKDFTEFSPGSHGNGYRRSIYLTDNPEIADIYANSKNYGLRGGGDPAIYPVFAKAEKPLVVSDKGPDGSFGWVSDNLATALGVDHPPAGKYASLYDEARRQGYDQVQIREMTDLGGPQTQYIPLEPNYIRSVNAAFDPAKSSSANLLAANPETSAAPGLGLMAAAKQAEQPHEPPLMSILRAKGILP